MSGTRAAILLSAALAVVLMALPQAAAGAPLLGYNDDFNVFEPHDTNDPADIIPNLDLPFDPPLLPPLLGGGGGEEPDPEEPGRASFIRTAALGGADIVRYVVPWMRVERKKGSYDWSVEDETYDLVLAAGLKPLIVFTTSPCWAHPSVACNYDKYRSIRPDPGNLGHFARFAKQATKRYPEAVAFEVWNESNAKSYWGPDPSPRTYTDMLKAVRAETASVDPKPTLLYNGLLPGGPWRRYLRSSYMKQNAGGQVTALAIHPYVGKRNAKTIRRRITDSRRILRKAKTSRAIWITEVGWSTEPGAGDAVSVGQQARYVEGLERIARKRRLKSIVIHRLKDLEHESAWEAGLGAITRDGMPKPLFCSLASRHRPESPPPPGC